MNFIFVSPNFPATYYLWTEALKKRGVRVLGIGDTPYHELTPSLLRSLDEYYFLPNLGSKPDMTAAVAYYEKKYGKIDYIESNNEWWLEMDAYLRETFHVDTGFHPSDMLHIKAKSEMKAYFQKGGAKTMRYLLVHGEEDKAAALEFIAQVGYPVFVKPNIGVGALSSYALHNEEELDSFLSKPLPETFIMEEFVDGKTVSFDGVCDGNGEVVFWSTEHFPIPSATVVNEKIDEYFWSNPASLPCVDVLDIGEFERIGRGVVKSFGIKKRFFHIEFFILNQDKEGLAKKGEIVAIECNMRAPGGYIPDVINFANSSSCYDIWADVIVYGENRQDLGLPKYYCFSCARRDEYLAFYVHSEADVLSRYGERIKMHGRYPKHIADDMGDIYFFGVFPSMEEGKEFVHYIRDKGEAFAAKDQEIESLIP